MTEDELSGLTVEVLRDAQKNGMFLNRHMDAVDVDDACKSLGSLDAALRGLTIDRLKYHVESYFKRSGQYKG